MADQDAQGSISAGSPVAPAPITEAILDEPIEQLPLVYLPTSSEESAYLKTGRERRATIRYWGNPVEVGILSGYQVELARAGFNGKCEPNALKSQSNSAN